MNPALDPPFQTSLLFELEVPPNNVNCTPNATMHIHSHGATFEIPTTIGSTAGILPPHGCRHFCSLGPCILKCTRQITHLPEECCCEAHETTIDSVAFSGHMRHYLASAGIDTSHMTSCEVCDSSLRTLKMLATRELQPTNFNPNT